jgi:hypothetical protein
MNNNKIPGFLKNPGIWIEESLTVGEMLAGERSQGSQRTLGSGLLFIQH